MGEACGTCGREHKLVQIGFCKLREREKNRPLGGTEGKWENMNPLEATEIR
jgi:hypothetical protein